MPVQNEHVAEILDEIADLLAIQDANPFRVRAYHNAARTVRGLSRELHDLIARGKDLTDLPGIGDDLAGKIREIVGTGACRALEKLHRQVPHELEELLAVPGLGPKRVKALFYDLRIRTTQQLEKAARAGRLRKLPGFGQKLEQRILQAVAARQSGTRRFSIDVAEESGGKLAAYLGLVPGTGKAIIAGSFRRGRETVGDLDILVTTSRPAAVMERFAAYDQVARVTSRGATRASAVLRNGLQVDLRVVPKQSFGAALHYFTGGKAHNIRVRTLGQKFGLKINEYGVFRGARRVAGATEASVFKSVGLPLIPPELREDRGEIEAARAHRLPRLVEEGDLRGDLHVIANGRDDLVAMAIAAKRRGLRYIAFTIRQGPDAPADAVLRQLDRIDQIRERADGMVLLKGIEAEIPEDGRLDLPTEVLARLDLLIGAAHGQFELTRARQTARLLRAMDSPCFTILAHPGGRLLPERDACSVDMERIVRAARVRGCFLELNSQPQRLDLADVHCQMAKAEGVLVSINSGARQGEDFRDLRFGITQARRGWLEKDDVLNTRPHAALKRLLRRTMD
ncbi:MAG: DNA polymerase III [Gammaproteobacteria bacterium]|nr:DNA polymerase III [Gammaproteobacteria bacterium]